MQHAHDFFTTHSHPHATHLGRKIQAIRIRDTKSSWGSCRRNGTLTFSWRLLLAPREVAEYVSFHEICHLKEMNHGPKFWKLVEGFCPDHKKHRKWLRTEGKMLAHVKLDSFLQ
jgi:predicted metal-dependent hydrolase